MVGDALGDRGDAKRGRGPAAWINGEYVDVNAADPEMPATVRELLELGPDWQRRAWAALPRGVVRHDPANVRLLAPVPDPRKIICIGLNYRDHAAESGVPVPTEPVLFSKYPTALIGHGAPIVLPRVSQEVDYEAELVVVIGRRGRHIPRERAFEHVGGYAVGHDVSARDWQLNKPGKQWMAGKTFDTFAPVGPELVTPDEVPDPHNLGIRLRLERPDHARLEHQPAHLRGRRADRLPLADLHPRAGRPDLHRHAAGRRHGAQAAGLAQAGRCRRGRDRSPGHAPQHRRRRKRGRRERTVEKSASP